MTTISQERKMCLAVWLGADVPKNHHEYEVQCYRCGSSVSFEACEYCGGEGVDGHECGEDTCSCFEPEDNMACGVCEGAAAFVVCLSSPVWCQAHPLPGREQAVSGTPEWFCILEAGHE